MFRAWRLPIPQALRTKYRAMEGGGRIRPMGFPPNETEARTRETRSEGRIATHEGQMSRYREGEPARFLGTGHPRGGATGCAVDASLLAEAFRKSCTVLTSCAYGRWLYQDRHDLLSPATRGRDGGRPNAKRNADKSQDRSIAMICLGVPLIILPSYKTPSLPTSGPFISIFP